MTADEEQPRTPLTLEFSPEPLDGDEQSAPVIIAEPSFQHSGRIFLGVHPFGKRLGCHLLPQDARKVRDHLTKLLLEPGEEPEPTEQQPPPADWQARIQAAAQRVAASKKVKRLAHFRFEGQIGRFAFVIGTTDNG